MKKSSGTAAATSAAKWRWFSPPSSSPLLSFFFSAARHHRRGSGGTSPLSSPSRMRSSPALLLSHHRHHHHPATGQRRRCRRRFFWSALLCCLALAGIVLLDDVDKDVAKGRSNRNNKHQPTTATLFLRRKALDTAVGTSDAVVHSRDDNDELGIRRIVYFSDFSGYHSKSKVTELDRRAEKRRIVSSLSKMIIHDDSSTAAEEVRLRYPLKNKAGPGNRVRFDDQTRYYAHGKSEDFYNMERRNWPEHAFQKSCRPMYKWQSLQFPVCNRVHETMDWAATVQKRQLDLLSDKGFWRHAWLYDENYNGGAAAIATNRSNICSGTVNGTATTTGGCDSTFRNRNMTNANVTVWKTFK